MIYRRFVEVLASISVTFFLAACADDVSERSGAQIQVIPVTYSLGISIKQGNEQAAWDELDKFVADNWNKVSTQTVNLNWYTDTGKKLADDYHALLLKKGLNRQQLKVEKAIPIEDTPFDLQFQTVVNKVMVDICDYDKVGQFDSSQLGCYAEGARWQSMVNPEKMISTNMTYSK